MLATTINEHSTMLTEIDERGDVGDDDERSQQSCEKLHDDSTEANCPSTPHAQHEHAQYEHTPHKRTAQWPHSNGTHSRSTQREHGKCKRAKTKACTASTYISGARNASMGDAR